MFDVGFTELVLVSIIGLLVLGPQRLPKVAAEIGKWVGRARRTASQLRRQLEREIELSELEERISSTAAKQPPGQSPPPATGPVQQPAPSGNEPPATSAANESAGSEPTIAPPAEPRAEHDAQEQAGVVHELGESDGVERLEKSRSG